MVKENYSLSVSRVKMLHLSDSLLERTAAAGMSDISIVRKLVITDKKDGYKE